MNYFVNGTVRSVQTDKRQFRLWLVGACLIVIAIGLGLAGCAEIKAGGQPQPTADALGTLLQEKQTARAETTQTQSAPLPPTQPPAQGILDGIAPPFNTDVFWSGGNQWNGYINNVFTIVYAGSRGNDHEQGVVVVVTDTSEEWFDTPAKDGTLTISSANGTVLSLTSTNESAYQFNLNNKSFLLIPTPDGLPTVPPVVDTPAAPAPTAYP
jgi:hypothetical protein